MRNLSSIYHTVIVGGGIAGLYTAYRLLKRSPTMRIFIIEKSPDVGGRVYTYDGFKGAMVEAGAGRFSNHHVRLRKLIRELGLEKHVFRIDGGFSYVPSSSGAGEPSVGAETNVAEVVRISKKTSATELRNQSFLDYAKQVIGEERAQHIVDSFGYYSELVMMNAYDAIRLMRILDTNSKSNTFYGLSGGLSQIIAGLKTAILRHSHAEIRVKSEVVRVLEHSSSTTYECVLADGSSIRARQCVFALPRPALEKIAIFRPIRGLLKSVVCSPLCRIYCRYPTDLAAAAAAAAVKGSWFAGLPKITTDNPLRMVIPVDEGSGVLMASYTDNRFARAWKRLFDRSGIHGVEAELGR
jgi:monoamine oxidase